MLQIGVLVAFFAVSAIYAAPSVIAIMKGARSWLLVVVINISLGWTIIGWLLALAIALGLAPRRPAWTRRLRMPRARTAPVPRRAGNGAGADGDPNDPPLVREDAYAAWLEEGAAMTAAGREAEST